jgi:hypothetical protein
MKTIGTLCTVWYLRKFCALVFFVRRFLIPVIVYKLATGTYRINEFHALFLQAQREEFEIVLYLVEKVLIFLPEALSQRWQYHR